MYINAGFLNHYYISSYASDHLLSIIYISGSGRSGSTLLERVFNSSPNTLALGEFHCLWRLPPERITCSCGLPFEQDDFWRDVLKRANIDKPVIDELRHLEAKVARTPFLLRHRMSRTSLLRDPDVQRFLALQFQIFEQVSLVSGRNILVDSSKAGPRAWLMSCDPRVRTIHLYRDPKDVIASWRSAKFDRGMDGNMQRMSVHGAAIDWLKVEQLSRLFAPNDPVTRIDYENLCRHPQATIESALSTLDLCEPIVPNWLGPTQILPGALYHSLNGNPDRFDKGPITIAARAAKLDQFSAAERTYVRMMGKGLRTLYPRPVTFASKL